MIAPGDIYDYRILQRFLTTIIVLGFLLTPAIAGETCASFNSLKSYAESGFSGSFDPKHMLASEHAPNCSVSRELSGGQTYICHWKFGYRSDNATKGFNQLDNLLRSCLGDNAQVRKDKPVNHPDAYDLKTYKTETITFSVSLKDKAALDETYIFLRVEAQ